MPSTVDHHGIALSVDDDASVARLIFPTDGDPSAWHAEAIVQFIRDNKVVVVDSIKQQIDEAIAAFRAAPAQRELIVAKAVPVNHGVDGHMKWQPGCDPQVPTGDAAAVSAKIDYYNQAHYVSATARSLLGTIQQPTDGSDGVDVRGKVLKAKPGTALAIKSDGSVTISEDGSVTAAIDGLLNYHGGTIRVMPVFEIAGSANFATGNIYFRGCVVIRGDVCDRFTVHARDDLTVYGLIGASTVICGRNFHAHCGAASHDRGCLAVGGDANIGYLKNVRGVIRNLLVARREILNCDIAIGQNLVCESGAVIGGSLVIGGSAVVGTLGSPTGTSTTIVFGAHPDSVINTCASFEEPGDGEVKAVTSGKALGVFAERIRKKLDSEIIPTIAKPVNLTIKKFLHPGVIVRSGRTKVRLESLMRGPIHIFGDADGELFYRLADGVSHPLAELNGPLRNAG